LRVLITGGAGYLGSVLSRKLLAKGYNVRVMDTLWYGSESIEDLKKNENFELIKEDIRNLVPTVKAMIDVDAVIHLASIVGMPASSIEPRTSEEINYLATKNIAELCQLHDIETYIFASTCSVYGYQPNKIINEKSHVAPLDFYAKQKYLSERATGWLNRSPTIYRFGTLFGLSPRMRFDLVINLFVAQALTDGKITVFGGKQERPFLHVSDAADSLIFGIEKNITGTYNVISENMTILQAAERIKKIIGCEIEISTENEDNRSYRVSAEKIKQVGFTPLKNLDDTIKEIKDAFSNKLLKDYNDVKYNNYKLLYSSKEMQKEVFIKGISGSLDIP
jgi:nucleoside-diphosphate-sugar epimerase